MFCKNLSSLAKDSRHTHGEDLQLDEEQLIEIRRRRREAIAAKYKSASAHPVVTELRELDNSAPPTPMSPRTYERIGTGMVDA